jgi:hypothetical protein
MEAGTKEGGDEGEENDEGTHGRGGKQKSITLGQGRQFTLVVFVQPGKIRSAK